MLKFTALLTVLLMTTGWGLGCARMRGFAYSGFGRDGWQQPERVIETLAIEKGSSVADLGAGAGYFTFKLADAVGPDGRVYAVDLDEPLLAMIAERAADESRPNVHTVVAAPDRARLPEAVDLVFTCNTYHHLGDRVAYFERLRASLRPGGRVAILDLKPGSWFLGDHATAPDVVEREMLAAGYEKDARHDFLSRQEFLVFRAP